MKGQLERFSDDLILAGIDRAERHTGRDAVPLFLIYDHLSVRRRSGAARKIRARVLAMSETGALEQTRLHGMEVWSLTAIARNRLRRAGQITDLLPEAPQHRKWRHARTLEEHELPRYNATLRTVLVEAEAMLDAREPASSDAWLDMSRRLQRNAWRIGAALYCLYEWDEPSDEERDNDGDGAYLGRRNVTLWRDADEPPG
jgi:hypothetical protein